MGINKQLLFERRTLTAQTMTRTDNLQQAFRTLKEKFPTLKYNALVRDWERRHEWLPNILQLQDNKPLVDSISAMRDYIKQAYTIYLQCEVGYTIDAQGNRTPTLKNHAVALGALRTCMDGQQRLVTMLQNAGYVAQPNPEIQNTIIVNNTQVKVNQEFDVVFQQYQNAIDTASELVIQTNSNRKQLDTLQSPNPPT